MRRHFRNLLRCAFAAGVCVMVVVGCTRDPNTKSPIAKAKEDDKHGHAPVGPHAGALAEWGKDQFHAEFTLDHTAKRVTIYILDDKATKAPSINAAKVFCGSGTLRRSTNLLFSQASVHKILCIPGPHLPPFADRTEGKAPSA